MKNATLLMLIFLLLLALVACNAVDDVEPTARPSEMTSEQAVVEALSGFLVGQGAPVVQMDLQVQKIADNYAWVEVISTDPVAPGGFNAFMKLEDGLWTTVVSGSGMEKEQVEALGIPQSVWPELWLSTPGQPALPATASGPPICPNLPRPAMVFLSDNGQGTILRHAASGSECTMSFDPAISRLLTLTADGIYYLTPDIGDDSAKQKLIHYGNDGAIRELSFVDADNIRTMAVSSNGTELAWSQLRLEKTAEDQEIVVSELYTANANGDDLRLLHSVDNAAEVERGEPYIAWMIRPLQFLDDGGLLFTVGPDGLGGSWNAYTGRYSNLYYSSITGSENELIYECPVDDYSSLCIGAVSEDSTYFAVTERQTGEVTLFHIDGTEGATYSGPGQEYVGYPTFGPADDLVFLSADVADDQVTIEQGFLSLVTEPYEKGATTLLSEPLSYIWGWVDAGHVLYTAVEGGQTPTFWPSLVSLDGDVERLPSTYSLFQGVLP